MTHREWPFEADPLARNPRVIEDELSACIRRAQVALLGELDLSAATDYAGIGWSMYELASFCMETAAVRGQLETSGARAQFSFPAVLAVWAVARAQELEDGGELWATAPIAKTKQGLIGPKFREAIQALGLEDFSDHLKAKALQQYVALARMHAIIPTYALRGYVEHIRRGCERHQHPNVVHQELITASDMKVPVRQLLLEKPDLGLDLISRSMLSVRRGADSGLPPRLTTALIDKTRAVATTAFRGTEPPVLKLDPTLRQLYIAEGRGWTISAPGRDVDTENIPALDLVATHRIGGILPLLSLTDGYLIFDSNLSLTDGRSIPNAGGYLLWGADVDFDLALLSAEPDTMVGSWRGWQLAPIHAQARFELRMPNGAVRYISVRQALTVHTEPLRWLHTDDNLPVFGVMPHIEPGQSASAIDHRTGERRQLSATGAVISDITDGPIDVTIFATLGRSVDVKGLYIPGLTVDGADASLLPSERRTVTLRAEPDWMLPGTLDITAPHTEPHIISVRGPQGQHYELMLDPTVVTWSIEFTGQALEYLASTGTYRYEQLANLRRLVIHGLCDTDELRLSIHEGEAHVMTVPGSRRQADLLFDLRAIAGASRHQRVDLKASIGNKPVTLASFLPRERLTRLHSMDQLKDAVKEKGWFSDAEWQQLEAERELENLRLRTMRRMRGWK